MLLRTRTSAERDLATLGDYGGFDEETFDPPRGTHWLAGVRFAKGSGILKPSVLFCTDHILDTFGDRIRTTLPPVDVVALRDGEAVSDHDLQRITIAFFSGDSWPGRSAAFIKVCLSAPNLQWLHTFSAGVDSPVFGEFVRRGVRLTTSSGASARPIAQTVAWMIIGLSRDAPAWTRAQQEHLWSPRLHQEIDGLSLAVIGMGPIGEETARLGAALGMTVRGCRRTITGHEPCSMVTFDELDSLLEWADYVVLALPLTPDTQGLIGVERLAMMKPSARLINVGRGLLVDEIALVEALKAGRLAGAGLDVFAVEPLPVDSDLWDMPNVIITPHNSADTKRSYERAAEIFVDNLARFGAGEALRNEVLATTAS